LDTVIETWADWIWKLHQRESTVPEDVLQGSALRTVDVLGCAARGFASSEIRAIANVYAQDGLRGPRALDLISPGGDLASFDALDMAFVLAASSHSMDYDDTHFPSLTHPTAACFGAACAAGAMFESHADRVLEAVTIGREITVRLGLAFKKELGHRGLNTSTIAGTVGSAAAVSYLRPDLTPQLAARALSLAAGVGGGTQEWAATGAANKWLQFGFAASTGFRAALTADQSFNTASAAIEGKAGLLRAFSPSVFDDRPLTARIGHVWYADDVVLKPYPYPNGTHTIFDAIDKSAQIGLLSPGEIDSVELEISQYTETLMCLPWEVKCNPTSDYALRFSLPTLVALALHNRMQTDQPFVRSRASVSDVENVRDLVRKVSYRLYRDAMGNTPLIGVPGRVCVRTRNGGEIVAVAERRDGGYMGTHLSAAEVREKFVENVLVGAFSDENPTHRSLGADLELLESLRVTLRQKKTVDLSTDALLRHIH
jgi:2-methylcitrate dehydratase PrpD